MCLIMRFDASRNLRTYVWLHVDDTFITSTHQEEIERFHEVLQSKFKVTIDFFAAGVIALDDKFYLFFGIVR